MSVSTHHNAQRKGQGLVRSAPQLAAGIKSCSISGLLPFEPRLKAKA